MSLEKEDELGVNHPVETAHDSEKTFKLSYTREFLLSLSELDVCKRLPSDFDQSLLSEFEDTSQDRQRISGNAPLHGFRRNEYGSSPPTRGELGNYSRGIHGRWDNRSSGRSDRDSDSQSDWDSDSGKRFSTQSRRSWQVPEHDGLLGSGSFPRPSGFSAGASAPRFRSNDSYQLGTTNEPYHPPRPYKAVPHSRRDTDSYNDETFGSSEYTSEDRAEEERKRRASFELLRKEQHKSFQEKQKLNPEGRKNEFDITELLEDSKDEKRLPNKSHKANEPVVLPVPDNDSQKLSLPSQAPASRPLVPPGFRSTILEKNFVAKTLSDSRSSEAANSQPEGGLLHAKGNQLLNGTSSNHEERQSAVQVGIDEQQQEKMGVPVSAHNMSDKSLSVSSAFDASTSSKISIGNQLCKDSNLSEPTEVPTNGEIIEVDSVKTAKGKLLDGSSQDPAPSILDKLFGSAITLNGGDSSSFIEHRDGKADETWSPQAVHSSKFAYLFLEEEKKPVDDISSSRPNELLSLIQGGERGGYEISDVKATKQFSSELPFTGSESADRHIGASLECAKIENSEQFCNSSVKKSAAVPGVLTCEDLEQSILSEIKENDHTPTSPSPLQGWSMRMEQQKLDINDHASQHLLSLLQRGIGPPDMVQLPILDDRFLEKEPNVEIGSTGTSINDKKEATVENVAGSGKALTLETLFGTAFMTELQSIGAPLSAKVDVPESHGLPLQLTEDDCLHSTIPFGSDRTTYQKNITAPNQREQMKSDNFAEQFISFDGRGKDMDSSQLQSESGSKCSRFDGSVDIRLPEEGSLIAASNPLNLQNFMPIRSSVKTERESPVNIAEKLAALNSVLRDERSVVRCQDGLPFLRGPHDVRDPDFPFHNLNVQPSSPQLHSQLNHAGPMFHSLDNHRANINSQVNFMAPEGIVRHDPPNHQFPANMIRPPFHHPSSGLDDFDPPPHHPMLQQMHIPGNFPPPQLLQGFPRGAPMPSSNNQPTGYIPEMNPMQGFPLGLRQPNFAGLGIPPGHDAGRNEHSEALQRLIDMELRAKSKQIPPPYGAGGQSHGIYGHELDMGFGYR